MYNPYGLNIDETISIIRKYMDYMPNIYKIFAIYKILYYNSIQQYLYKL